MSKGADILYKIICKILPGRKIKKEYLIDGKMRIDFFIPELKLGIEYDGRQHDEFVKHFHKSASGFLEAKMRDKLKSGFCENNGISLIRFSHDEELTEELVRSKIMEILNRNDT